MHELMMALVATLLGLFLAHEIWSIGSLIVAWLTGDPDRIDTMDELGRWSAQLRDAALNEAIQHFERGVAAI